MGKALPFNPDRKPSQHSIPEGMEVSPEVVHVDFGNFADEDFPEGYAERREKIDKVVDEWISGLTPVLKAQLSEVALGNVSPEEVSRWANQVVGQAAGELKKLHTRRPSADR